MFFQSLYFSVAKQGLSPDASLMALSDEAFSCCFLYCTLKPNLNSLSSTVTDADKYQNKRKKA